MKYRLTDLNYKPFAIVDRRTYGGCGSPSNSWDMVLHIVADEFGCDVDDVGSAEKPDDTMEEILTVRGEPVARLIYEYGWNAI